MRKLLRIFTLAAVAGCAAAPLHAQQPAPKISAQRPAADPNERICRDIALTGSRMVTKRFCATRAEWQEREQQDRDQIELMQRPMQCSIMGGKHC